MEIYTKVVSQKEFEETNLQLKDYESGLVIIWDKPKGCTSHDVVGKVRKEISRRTGLKIKVGHSGTLDPLARGLLLILVGRATKIQDSFMNMDKEYVTSMVVGFMSSSYDLDGEIKRTEVDLPNNLQEVRHLLDVKKSEFAGKIEQQVPSHSAVKVRGKKLYKYQREGVEIPFLPKRQVEIFGLEVTGINRVDFEKVKTFEVNLVVNCSSGTYIRSLVHDLGAAMGWGAVVTNLRRTRIGMYHL